MKPDTVILHSRADDVVPFADSEELVRNSGLAAAALVEVGSDHRLADPEPLAAMLRACGHAPPTLTTGDVVRAVVRRTAVFGLFWFVRTTPAYARLQQVVLSLVLAGALGNLYDNFTRADRSVRDFLRFSGRWPTEWDFPAFNVADSCITVGAIGLFLLLWRDDRKAAAKRVS